MNAILTKPYTVTFDLSAQEIQLTGRFRPFDRKELRAELRKSLDKIKQIRGLLYLNCRKVMNLNSLALSELLIFVHEILETNVDVQVRVITTSVVAWGGRLFSILATLGQRVSVEEYDKNFYPGQGVFENADFIRVLRCQTKMTWRHEKELLKKHGLVPGMAMADICCGIGDFAQLVWREFKPSRLVAVDHAKHSLEYARKVAHDFGLDEIEYQYGDASSLLLDDNQFDFVTCRHSLQVFNKPELIVKELVRICKPGGIIYISNEKNSHCHGEPRGESVQWTYQEVAKLWDYFDMDIELGPKQLKLLTDAHLLDAKIEEFNVTNRDGGDPQDFADVVQSWQDCFDSDMAVRRGDNDQWRTKFRQGFQDHIYSILHPQGYASWPIWVASGKKA